MEKLKKLISTYENYPKTGVNFKDVLEIVHYPKIFKELILKMSSSELIRNAEALISIDARGFVFGSAIALQTSKPMIVARKPGKLPGEIIKKKYNLEYGENVLTIQKNSIKKFNSFAIIDDLIATGGTAECVSKILDDNNKKVTGLLVVVELQDLRGALRFNYPIESILKYWFSEKKIDYIIPIEPAVKPTIRKKENSKRSLGRELIIKLNWVI